MGGTVETLISSRRSNGIPSGRFSKQFHTVISCQSNLKAIYDKKKKYSI